MYDVDFCKFNKQVRVLLYLSSVMYSVQVLRKCIHLKLDPPHPSLSPTHHHHRRHHHTQHPTPHTRHPPVTTGIGHNVTAINAGKITGITSNWFAIVWVVFHSIPVPRNHPAFRINAIFVPSNPLNVPTVVVRVQHRATDTFSLNAFTVWVRTIVQARFVLACFADIRTSTHATTLWVFD